MPNYAFDEEDGSDEKDVVNDKAKTLGMTWMPVENKMLQKFLGVEQGVVVANPSKLGGAYKVLYRGDVVTHIDGCNVPRQLRWRAGDVCLQANARRQPDHGCLTLQRALSTARSSARSVRVVTEARRTSSMYCKALGA